MYVVVVGGGKVGYYLTKSLLNAGHEVAVIEKDPNKFNQLVQSLNVLIVNGDGTDIDSLNAANAKEALVIAAVTGKDEDNLMVCQLAKHRLGTIHTIAHLNNPRNQAIFTRLGVETIISTASQISQAIEKENLHGQSIDQRG